MIAAISGAHTLGQARLNQSGYQGKWTNSPGKFNNEYYVNMLAKGWGRNLAVDGNKDRN
jgi:catalase (peroxidase I)